ncbi:MAG: molybdopterin-dependent oxidoreductase [Actinomycetota bacterium]|nr:molybdopterin-dependent oxidoreductase [Actinomycetota bacterium]
MTAETDARAGRPASPGGGEPPAETGRGAPIGRRVLLGMLAAGAVGIVAGRRIQNGFDAVLNPIVANDPTGLTSLIPGGDTWRIYTVTDGYPSVSPADYRLRVDGRVDEALNLSLADLQSMPPTSMIKDFQCVTGWRVKGVRWQGVLLSDVLDRAGVQPSGIALRFESYDGLYTESLTLDQARRGDMIVAYAMDGGPVSKAHGGPVRLYAAPMYGYKSCKWLSRVAVVSQVEPGYWERVGNYDVDAWVGRSNGRSDPATS